MGGCGDYKSLIEPIEERMMRSVWRIVRDVDDAEDALQNASEAILKGLERIRRHPNPHALILRICINAAYDVLRAKARRRETFEAPPETIPDPAPSASERLVCQEERAEALRAIGRLPRKLAEVALMRFAQEMPYAEIAEAIGCTETSARQDGVRARNRLRIALAHLAPNPAKEVSK